MGLYKHQAFCVNWLLDKPKAALLLDMGLGKTLVVLTVIKDLIMLGEVKRVLILGTKRVAKDTWPDEIEKWSFDFSYAVACGAPKKRELALQKEADVTITNYENLVWLIERYKQKGEKLPFDMLVIDESSCVKNKNTKRFRTLRSMNFNRVVALTGTPAPNSLVELWSQIYLLDKGERLEKYFGRYTGLYFRPGRTNGFITYNWNIRNGAEQQIYDKVDDIAVSMKKEDYLHLPAKKSNIIEVKLNKEQISAYNEFLRESVLELPTKDITAINAAVLTGKLMQYASGAVYDEDKKVQVIHNEKMQAVKEIIEEAQGQPVIIYYQYKHELARLQEQFPQAETLKDGTIARWNKGEIPILLLHPKSAGHGLNLQHGGHIAVWFSMTWSLEQYQQANDRIYRDGQTKPVIIHHLVAKGTVDERAIRVLSGKAKAQEEMLEALKAVL